MAAHEARAHQALMTAPATRSRSIKSSRAQEAQAFEKRNFVSLHQSTLRKVDVIANISERAHDWHLKTNTTWWKMHGGRLRIVLAWFAENKLIAFVASLASIIGLGIAIYALK
jgi:hypothetical protein